MKLLALSLLLAALCLAAVGPAFVNHDAAWYLYMARQWLGGATLYRDIIDTNPPLIVWLSSVPVWIAGWTGAGAPALFKAFMFGITAASLWTVYRTVRRAWPQHEFLVTSAAVFLCLPFVKGDFGQREHLAVLLAMPYVVTAAAAEGDNSRRRRWLIGVAGGLGFALKPHFLLALLAVELSVLAQRGRRARLRPECLGAAGMLALYAGAVVLFAHDYFTVADQVRQVYGGLNSPFFMLLRLREVQLWIVALALLLAIRWPASERLPPVAFAAATGFLLAALLQLKGWSYHLYPARVFIVLFFVAGIGAVLHQVPAAAALLRGGFRGLAVLFAGAMLVASGRYIAEARTPPTPDLVKPLVEAIDQHASGGPVAVLSMRTIIYPAFPAVNYSGARWAMRHNSLWFLPGFYEYQDLRGGGALRPHSPDAMSPLERLFFDQIADDLCADPPRILAIERPAASAPAGRRALDLQAYYGQRDRMRRLFARYQPQGAIGPFLVLTSQAPSCE